MPDMAVGAIIAVVSTIVGGLGLWKIQVGCSAWSDRRAKRRRPKQRLIPLDDEWMEEYRQRRYLFNTVTGEYTALPEERPKDRRVRAFRVWLSERVRGSD